MELRSSRNRNEYKELQITLNGMGFYEEGMELQEMRQILDALHQSVTDGETNFFDDDMERAIRESELDFMPMSNTGGGLWNSTMMGSQQISSPCSSPEIPPQVITVQVEVHHPLDWSPQCSEEERLQRKRLASTNEGDNNDPMKFTCNEYEFVEPVIKRIHDGGSAKNAPIFSNATPTENLSETNLHSSLSPNHENSPIQVVGPVSMRGPSNDSGVNSANESNKLWSSSLTEDNVSHVSNSPANSTSSSNDNHNVVGPTSARRPINDSGVVESNENEEVASMSWDLNMGNDDSMEWDNSTNENSVPLSLSSVANQFKNVYEEDYEQSDPSM